MIKSKQNNFSRSLINEAKAGAYYTDVEHCKWIGNFLQFPKEDEVCALDPSIGDGKAILTTIGDGKENVKIFGVELNKNTYEKTIQNSHFTKILNADFLSGIKISTKNFSFCFVNPPYGVTSSNERLETVFLQKTANTMLTNGILVYIVPIKVFMDKKFQQTWTARFTTAHVYRFHQKEYDKYKQIVLFGLRKPRNGYYKEELEQFNQYTSKDNIELLPENYTGKKLKVPSSNSQNISYFSLIKEDPIKNLHFLADNSLTKELSSKWSIAPYTATQINQPVVELNTNLKYLVAVSGGGQGLAGNANDGDLHLQRGTIKRVEHEHIEPISSERTQVIVTETSSVVMTLIENDGTVTRFE